MNTTFNNFFGRLENISPRESALAYALLLALFLTVWLTSGTAVASFAGGICFGLLASSGSFFRVKNDFFKSGLQALGFIGAIALGAWKEEVLMPANWEPSKHWELFGVAGLVFSFVLIALFSGGLKYEAASTPSPEIAEAADEVKGEPFHMAFSHLAILIVGLIANIVVMASYAFPEVIGTPRSAVARHIQSSIYDYRHKDGLAYFLASGTSVSLESIDEKEDVITAVVKVKTPVVPFSITEESVQTEVAKREFFKTAWKDRAAATITETLTLVPSGIAGWTISSGAINFDHVKISKDYLDGKLQVEKNPDPFASMVNMFGMHDFMISPFNMFAFLTVAFSSIFLAIGKPRVGAFGMFFGVALSLAPIFLVSIGA